MRSRNMVVVGEPAAGETIFFFFYVFLFFFFIRVWDGVWPSGKAAIFDVVSVGSSPSIPKLFKNVLGTYFMEYFFRGC